MIKEGLTAEKGSTVIPFSAETKQGRDEIWDLAEREYLFPERFWRMKRKNNFGE